MPELSGSKSSVTYSVAPDASDVSGALGVLRALDPFCTLGASRGLCSSVAAIVVWSALLGQARLRVRLAIAPRPLRPAPPAQPMCTHTHSRLPKPLQSS